VGGAVGGIAILCLGVVAIWWMLRRNRKQRKGDKKAAASAGNDADEKNDADEQHRQGGWGPSELADTQTAQELEVPYNPSGPPAELPVSNGKTELPGT